MQQRLRHFALNRSEHLFPPPPPAPNPWELLICALVSDCWLLLFFPIVHVTGVVQAMALRVASAGDTLIELAVDCLPSSVHLNGGVATFGDLRSRCGNSEACIAPPCTPVHSPPAKHPARVALWMDAALVWLLALWLLLWLLEAGLRFDTRRKISELPNNGLEKLRFKSGSVTGSAPSVRC